MEEGSLEQILGTIAAISAVVPAVLVGGHVIREYVSNYSLKRKMYKEDRKNNSDY